MPPVEPPRVVGIAPPGTGGSSTGGRAMSRFGRELALVVPAAIPAVSSRRYRASRASPARRSASRSIPSDRAPFQRCGDGSLSGLPSSVTTNESCVEPLIAAVTSSSLPLAPSPARRVGSSARSNQMAICVAASPPSGSRLIHTTARLALKLYPPRVMRTSPSSSSRWVSSIFQVHPRVADRLQSPAIGLVGRTNPPSAVPSIARRVVVGAGCTSALCPSAVGAAASSDAAAREVSRAIGADGTGTQRRIAGGRARGSAADGSRA